MNPSLMLAILWFAGVDLAVGLTVAAVVMRYRRAAVPVWVGWLAAGAMGAGTGFGAILEVRDPPVLVALVWLPVLLLTLIAVRLGRRIAAGILLVLLGIPGMALWGHLLLHDAISSAASSAPTLWLWWLAPTTAVLAGLALILSSDRPQPARPLLAAAASHVRDPGVLLAAMRGEVSLAGLPLPQLVADGAGLVALLVFVTVTSALGVPAPIAWIIGALAYGGVSMAVYPYAMPARLRTAHEGFAAISHPEIVRWKAVTGTVVPTRPSTMRRWLASVPDRPETRWARAEVQATVGDLAGARASIAAMPLAGPIDRLEQHILNSYVDWLAGDDAHIDELVAEAETVGDPASEERLLARRMVAAPRARDLAATGGDWVAPLLEARATMPPGAAGRIMRGDLWAAWLPGQLGVGALLSGAVLLLSRSF
jgi:hypothetical protein